jgi:hypothetical protein
MHSRRDLLRGVGVGAGVRSASPICRVVIGVERDEPHEVPFAKREGPNLLAQPNAIDRRPSVRGFQVADRLPVKAFRSIDVAPIFSVALRLIQSGRSPRSTSPVADRGQSNAATAG